jgi:hypothetical protein
MLSYIWNVLLMFNNSWINKYFEYQTSRLNKNIELMLTFWILIGIQETLKFYLVFIFIFIQD